MTKQICDLCGNEVDGQFTFLTIEFPDDGTWQECKRELCPDCSKKLEIWMIDRRESNED